MEDFPDAELAAAEWRVPSAGCRVSRKGREPPMDTDKDMRRQKGLSLRQALFYPPLIEVDRWLKSRCLALRCGVPPEPPVAGWIPHLPRAGPGGLRWLRAGVQGPRATCRCPL